jgi:hypothetical protein
MNHYEYNIAGHWMAALINDDYTGLTAHEEKQLNNFINNLPVLGHWNIDDDSANYSIDEVSGDYAETYKAKLHFHD